jgi:hypothetical protein
VLKRGISAIFRARTPGTRFALRPLVRSCRTHKETIMNKLMLRANTTMDKIRTNQQAGKIGYAILWLLGVPLPILVVIYLIRGH